MEKKRIAIFGPPGVGKSTLIKFAKNKGILAFDFENFSNEGRLSRARGIFKKTEKRQALFGAADLQPKDFPSDVKLVLILPPKNIYLERLRERDEMSPHKKGQGGPRVYEGCKKFSHEFDKVISKKGSVAVILAEILK